MSRRPVAFNIQFDFNPDLEITNSRTGGWTWETGVLGTHALAKVGLFLNGWSLGRGNTLNKRTCAVDWASSGHMRISIREQWNSQDLIWLCNAFRVEGRADWMKKNNRFNKAQIMASCLGRDRRAICVPSQQDHRGVRSCQRFYSPRTGSYVWTTAEWPSQTNHHILLPGLTKKTFKQTIK